MKLESGSCAYTVAKHRKNKEKFSLIISNQLSDDLKNTLKGKLIINGTEFTLESDKGLTTTDGQQISTLPAQYPTFTIYKAGLFLVINGTHFILRWDYGNRIYLTIDSRWKGKLDGVCSEYVRTSSGLVLHKHKHVNAWKVDRKCKVQVNKTIESKEKWRWAYDRCIAIFNGTSLQGTPFATCLSRLNEERRKVLYKQCIEETCRLARKFLRVFIYLFYD